MEINCIFFKTQIKTLKLGALTHSDTAGNCFCLECPNFTMQAMSGIHCSGDNYVLMASTTVQFLCLYEDASSTTTYQWSVNGTVVSGLTTTTASIYIGSGSHSVTCRAMIDAGDNCTCDESKTLNFTVIGMHNSALWYIQCFSVLRKFLL